MLQEAELSGQADSENNLGGSSETMYFIGLDGHKRTISYCVKDVAGRVHQEGKIGSTRRELDCWMRTMPQPRTVVMEATIFSGWIYDQLLPHADKVKVAHPPMLRAIAASKKATGENVRRSDTMRIQTDMASITGAIHRSRPINSDDLLCAGNCGTGSTGRRV